MKLTYAEKLEMAAKLRSKSVVESVIHPEYEENVNKVVCEERNVGTREGDCHVYIFTPKEKKQIYPLYVNIHGGGFVREYSYKDTLFSSRIAYELGCIVVDIDYKLAPEYPFPTAVNQCYDVVKWVYENSKEIGIDTEKIVIGGHSAGGNLTAAILLMANQSKEFKVNFQILDYPYLDAATDPADKVTDKDVLPVERMRAFDALYLENAEDRKNPFVSLVCATKEMMVGLPPALVITAGDDCLRFEGEKYAMMMVQAGVQVTAKRYLNSNHGFVTHCIEEWKEAQKLIIDTLRQVFYYSEIK